MQSITPIQAYHQRGVTERIHAFLDISLRMCPALDRHALQYFAMEVDG